MWIYCYIESAFYMNVSCHLSFDEAFKTCSINVERDFAGHYIYHEDNFKQFIEKYNFVKYHLGEGYDYTRHLICKLDNLEKVQKFYPELYDPINTPTSNKQVEWTSSTKCDFCGRIINDILIDGITRDGPWATMCETCHVIHGVGKYGMGWGQKYQKMDNGKFIKIEG